MTAVFQLKRSFYLADVDAKGMFVKLGASGLACHGLYFGHLKEQSLGTGADGIALFERNAGERGDVDGERSFVELGQEAAA